jgi:predicted DNA-binding transcriptional regulator AlpA
MEKYLRFADLVAAGVVRSRQALSKWIRDRNFPKGRLLGPNSRVWTASEVQRWLDQRPTKMKPVPKSPGRPRKKTQTDHANA